MHPLQGGRRRADHGSRHGLEPPCGDWRAIPVPVLRAGSRLESGLRAIPSGFQAAPDTETRFT